MKKQLSTLLSVIIASACTSSTNQEASCSSVNSISTKPVVKLGGVLELEDITGATTRCTALFEFPTIEGKAEVTVTTARHCIEPKEGTNIKIRPYDGTGYLNIPSESEYIRKLGITLDLIKEYNLEATMDGTISGKSASQVFSNFNHGVKGTFTETLTRQLKQERAAFGKPLCSTNSEPSSTKSTSDIKSCFLFSDLVKFSAIADISSKDKLALFRSTKLGANIDMDEVKSTALKKWDSLLVDQTAAEVDAYVGTLRHAAGICTGEIVSGSPIPMDRKICDNIEKVKNELKDKKITDKFDTSVFSVAKVSTPAGFAIDKFHELAGQWHTMKNEIFSSEFVILGNNKSSATGTLSFGSETLSKIPTIIPSIHRSYGIVSHFNRASVAIEKGASGSLLVSNGVVVALLSSVDDIDTSGGISHIIPESKSVEVAVPSEPITAPISGIDSMPKLPSSPSTPSAPAKPLDPSTPPPGPIASTAESSIIVSDSDIPSSYTTASLSCGK